MKTNDSQWNRVANKPGQASPWPAGSTGNAKVYTAAMERDDESTKTYTKSWTPEEQERMREASEAHARGSRGEE